MKSKPAIPIEHRRCAGFTLIEILVTLAIITFIVSIAMLSTGIVGDDRDLKNEARRLSALLQMANDDATIQGRDFGLEIMRTGYRFVEYDPFLDQWFEIADDEFMRERNLDEGSEFELILEERRVLLEDTAKEIESGGDEDEAEQNRDLTDDYLPHILVLSSGDTSPFELSIVRASDQAEVILRMTPGGELQIEDESTDAS